MLLKINNKDFKRCLDFLDENPNWLEDYSNKDVNGKPINFVELIEIVWACV